MYFLTDIGRDNELVFHKEDNRLYDQISQTIFRSVSSLIDYALKSMNFQKKYIIGMLIKNKDSLQRFDVLTSNQNKVEHCNIEKLPHFCKRDFHNDFFDEDCARDFIDNIFLEFFVCTSKNFLSVSRPIHGVYCRSDDLNFYLYGHNNEFKEDSRREEFKRQQREIVNVIIDTTEVFIFLGFGKECSNYFYEFSNITFSFFYTILECFENEFPLSIEYLDYEYIDLELHSGNLIKQSGIRFANDLLLLLEPMSRGFTKNAKYVQNDILLYFERVDPSTPLYNNQNSYTIALSFENIAALAYEKDESTGKIVIFPMDKIEKILQRNNCIVRFENAYPLKNARIMRKLLQMTTCDIFLLATRNYAYGFISKRQLKTQTKNNKDYIIIDFKGKHVWTLAYRGIEQIKSAFGQFSFPKAKVDVDSLKSILESYGCNTSDELIEAIQEISKQSHGTMIVFTLDAKEEVQRLRNASIAIFPIDLKRMIAEKSFYELISSIDGAIICDMNGVCWAFGAILDGSTNSSQDSLENIARGARHNSAYRYYQSNLGRCFIVTVSEDGDITLLG